jgi:hypothetical protein
MERARRLPVRTRADCPVRPWGVSIFYRWEAQVSGAADTVH